MVLLCIMKNHQNGLVNIVLIVLIIVLISALGYITLIKKPTPVTEQQTNLQGTQSVVTVQQLVNNTISSQNKNNTSNLKIYSDSVVSFEYPNLLTVERNGDTVVISHSVNYKHLDPCDFKGDAPYREKIIDFSVSLKVVDQGIRDYIQGSGWPDWNYVSKNPFDFGSLSGFKVSPGIEGCGEDRYYITISPNKTLIIISPFVSEFNSINSDYQTYLNLPGIIKPDQAGQFLLKIISSLKVK